MAYLVRDFIRARDGSALHGFHEARGRLDRPELDPHNGVQAVVVDVAGGAEEDDEVLLRVGQAISGQAAAPVVGVLIDAAVLAGARLAGDLGQRGGLDDARGDPSRRGGGIDVVGGIRLAIAVTKLVFDSDRPLVVLITVGK